MTKIIFVLLLLNPIFDCKLQCNWDNAINKFKRPTYDFSVKLLDRVAQESEYHFVFSPLSTWLQLVTLAEGARGPTEEEIRKVTKHHRMLCLRRKYKEVISNMSEELSFMTKRTNVIVVDKLLNVKSSFKNEIRKTNLTKLLTLDFNDPEKAADETNDVIERTLDGVIDEGIQPDDFELSMCLMIETAFFKGEWKTPFNPVYTSTEPFYDEHGKSKGNVRLMSQTGYYNLTEVDVINAKVLELPFNSDNRISMLFFLPNDNNVRDLFYNLKYINLKTIFNRFELEDTQLTTVRIPRFEIRTELLNIPELIYDMGAKRIFFPDLADFKGISDYKIIPSLMQQIADIKVTENGATASVAEFLIHDVLVTEDFKADRPFAYMIVDRKTDIILFGGIYSNPLQS